MTGKTHLEAGIVSGLLFSCIALTSAKPTSALPSTLILIPASLGLGVIGGLLPDIDIPSSAIGKILKPVSFAINKLVGHRTLFHAPLLYAAAFCFVSVQIKARWEYWVFTPLFFGIASHLLLDLLNKSGIPLLFPCRKRFRILRAKNDGIIENAVELFLIGVGILIIVSLVISFFR